MTQNIKAVTLLKKARQAISSKLGFPPPLVDTDQEDSDITALPSQGVFITLKKAGQLRGCIGHLRPYYENLSEEIEACAQAAAFSDHRFNPVSAEELADIDIELSLLDPPELVNQLENLDPQLYGVIVSLGQKQGTLLPAIEGVDSPSQQLQIAASKAGIDLRDNPKIYRYRVQKFVELDYHDY